MIPFPNGLFSARPGLYTGLGDLVGSVQLAYGLRAYARAAIGVKCVNIRPGSGAANFDVNLLSDGAMDIATAIATAGVDAIGTGSIVGTTLTFVGGHIGDTVTGTGVLPGTWIVSGSSPTWTVNQSHAVASTTLTLTWGMFVATLYNQLNIGSGNAVQATTGNQPLLVPGAGPNGVLPAMFFNGSSTSLDTGGNTAMDTVSWVANSSNGAGSPGPIFGLSGGSACGHAGGTSGVYLYQGTEVTAAAPNNAWHSAAGVFNGAASIIDVDGTNTTVNPGTATNAGRGIGVTTGLSQFFSGYMTELVIWNSVLQTGAQLIAGNENKHAYWGF